MSRRVFLPSPRVWTITPQDTEQYGQMERVSVVRAILKAFACAWAAVRSKPNGVANAPEAAMKLRRETSTTRSPSRVPRAECQAPRHPPPPRGDGGGFLGSWLLALGSWL